MHGLNKAISVYGQLKSFGLDWREWLVSDFRKDQVIHLQHRADPDFKLKGRISSRLDGRLLLQSLTVISL